MIPYSTQSIDATDYDAVLETLSSEYLTCGPKTKEFEEAVCEVTGASYAVAVNSCTSALHLGLMALGIGPGDLVYVSAISFVASANCVRMVNGDVEFVDVSPVSGNINCDHLSSMLEKAEKAGRLPKALIAVDMAGRRCDFERIQSLSKKYGFKIIEDAAHALGAEYKGDKAGSGKYADITCLSFHPVKIITTAEGGMALTNNKLLAEKMRSLSSHGVIRDKSKLNDNSHPDYYYEMQALGFNYRMSCLHASLGLSQLERLQIFVEMRRKKAKLYEELLKDVPNLSLPDSDSNDSKSAWHLYQVKIENGKRDQIFEIMRKCGIGVQVHYLPIYRHPYYQALKPYRALEGAEEFFSKTLSIPLFPTLSLLKQQLVAAKLSSLLEL